jgi:hypothetical protein
MKMRHLIMLIVLDCATFLSSHPALAQFSQQGQKLVGSGAVNFAESGVYQGWSSSLSADGNTAIVGGYADNIADGAAWIWTRSAAGVWTQQGQKLVDTDSHFAFQGWSVALSADGNTAVVGGYADGLSAGAVWIWTRSAGRWTRQGNKLVGSGAAGLAFQGYSVALSADGNTAIVGGVFDNNQVGAAWIWTRSAGIWTQQGAKLVGSGSLGKAEQGWSVSLSADGNTAIVGGYADDVSAGAVWIWTRSGGVWTQQGAKLVATGAVGTASQGSSVSLSADGNTAFIGGYADNFGAGAAWVWKRSAGVWTQQGSKLVATGAVGTAQQGSSVSISADGNTAIVGGPADNFGAGAAWVWKRNAGAWTQQGPKLVGSGAAGPASQGYSSSLSADGKTAIVGGYSDDNNNGAAWVFASSGTAAGGCVAPERNCNIPVLLPTPAVVDGRGP